MPGSLVGLVSTIALNKLFHSGSFPSLSDCVGSDSVGCSLLCRRAVTQYSDGGFQLISLAPDHQCPDDAGTLGRQCHGSTLVASSLDQGLGPQILGLSSLSLTVDSTARVPWISRVRR